MVTSFGFWNRFLIHDRPLFVSSRALDMKEHWTRMRLAGERSFRATARSPFGLPCSDAADSPSNGQQGEALRDNVYH
jgi:hypothetical protein